MKINSKVLLGVLVAAVVIGGAFFAGSSSQKGALTAITRPNLPNTITALPGPKLQLPVTCGSEWGKVFEGNVTSSTQLPTKDWWGITASQPISLVQLRSLLNQGCEFRVAATSASGGGSGSYGYECNAINIYDNDAVFACNSYRSSQTGRDLDAQYQSLQLGFDNGGTYYVPNMNQPDPSGPFSFALFAKK